MISNFEYGKICRIGGLFAKAVCRNEVVNLGEKWFSWVKIFCILWWKGARADFPFLSFPPGIPKGIDYGVVDNVFLSVEGIVAVHDLRIWGLTTDKTALSAHLAISKCIITITFCS